MATMHTLLYTTQCAQLFCHRRGSLSSIHALVVVRTFNIHRATCMVTSRFTVLSLQPPLGYLLWYAFFTGVTSTYA